MRALAIAAVLWAAPAGAASMGSPQLDYVLHCSGCHGPEGKGVPDKGVPRLLGNIGKLLHAPDGRAFIVQAPGVSHSPLNDAELARLLNWLLPRMDAADMPADAAPYTAAEVTALRGARKSEYLARRKDIVAVLAAQGIQLDEYAN